MLGVTKAGHLPGDYWQIDFEELPHEERCQHILVLGATFSGWLEAYPCRTNTAKEVVKSLLHHKITCSGFPWECHQIRDHFVATMVKEVSRILGITWDLHKPYRPQASGKVQCMNGTLKTRISENCQETSMTCSGLTYSFTENSHTAQTEG